MFEKLFNRQIQELRLLSDELLENIEKKRKEFDSEYVFENWCTYPTVYKRLRDKIQNDLLLSVQQEIEQQFKKQEFVSRVVEQINKTQVRKGRK